MMKKNDVFIIESPLEASFEYESTRRWIQNNTLHLLSTIIIYLTVIYIGRQLMSSRRPFKLTRSLIAWNVSLSLFSLMGSIRITQEFVQTYQRSGLHGTICYANKSDGPYALWSFLFTMSKVVELIDTLFIVLRKSPLIFLHWYHHAITLAFGVLAASSDLSLGRWIMIMNFYVHFFMYGYYALKQLGVRVPKPVAMSITSLQLAQMAIGISVFTYAYWLNNSQGEAVAKVGENITLSRKLPCETSSRTIITGLLMYFSYLILFIHFFIRTYFGVARRTAKVKCKNSVTILSDVNDNVTMSKKVH